MIELAWRDASGFEQQAQAQIFPEMRHVSA
jgi:hypothetical protein